MKQFFHHGLLITFYIFCAPLLAMQKIELVKPQPFIDRKRLQSSIMASYNHIYDKNLSEEQQHELLKEAAQETFLNQEQGYLILKKPLIIEKYKNVYTTSKFVGYQNDNFIKSLFDKDGEFKKIFPDVEDGLALITQIPRPAKKSVHFAQTDVHPKIDGGFMRAELPPLKTTKDKCYLLKTIVTHNQEIEKELKIKLPKPEMPVYDSYYLNRKINNEAIFIPEDKKTEQCPNKNSQQENEISRLLQQKAQRIHAIELASKSSLEHTLEEEAIHLKAIVTNYVEKYGPLISVDQQTLCNPEYLTMFHALTFANEISALQLLIMINEHNKHPTMNTAKDQLCNNSVYHGTLGKSYFKLLEYLKNPTKKYSLEEERELCNLVMESEYNMHANTALQNKIAVLKIIHDQQILPLLAKDQRDLSKLLLVFRNDLDWNLSPDIRPTIMKLYTQNSMAQAALAYAHIREYYDQFDQKYELFKNKFTTPLKLALARTAQEVGKSTGDQTLIDFAKHLNKKICVEDPFCAQALYDRGLQKYNTSRMFNIAKKWQAMHYWHKAAQLGETRMVAAAIELQSPQSTFFSASYARHILLALSPKSYTKLSQEQQKYIQEIVAMHFEMKKIIDSCIVSYKICGKFIEPKLLGVPLSLDFVIRDSYHVGLFSEIAQLSKLIPFTIDAFLSLMLCMDAERMLDKTDIIEQINNNPDYTAVACSFYNQKDNTQRRFFKHILNELCKQKNPHAAYLDFNISKQNLKCTKQIQLCIDHPNITRIATSDFLEKISNCTHELNSIEFYCTAAGFAARLLKQHSLSEDQKKWSISRIAHFANLIKSNVHDHQKILTPYKAIFNTLYDDLNSLDDQIKTPIETHLAIISSYYGLINNKQAAIFKGWQRLQESGKLTDEGLMYLTQVHAQQRTNQSKQSNTNTIITPAAHIPATQIEKPLEKTQCHQEALTPVNPYKDTIIKISTSLDPIINKFDNLTVKFSDKEAEDHLKTLQESLESLQQILTQETYDQTVLKLISDHKIFINLETLKFVALQKFKHKYSNKLHNLFQLEGALHGYYVFLSQDPSLIEYANQFLADYTCNPTNQVKLYLSLAKHYMQTDKKTTNEFIALAKSRCSFIKSLQEKEKITAQIKSIIEEGNQIKSNLVNAQNIINSLEKK